MHTQLANNALRYTQYAVAAWLVFGVGHLFGRIDPALFGFPEPAYRAFDLAMQFGFAGACIFSAATFGVAAFSKVSNN